MTNQNLYPTNDTLAKKLSELETKINSVSLSRQPYIADWIDVTEPSTGAVNGTITFTDTNVDATKIFSKGDRIRLKQGGAYKYFYVIGTSSNTAIVNAGDDYTLAATGITDFAYSRFPNPSSFPSTFAYTPVIEESSDGTNWTLVAGPPLNLDFKYNIIGNVVFISLDIVTLFTAHHWVRVNTPFTNPNTPYTYGVLMDTTASDNIGVWVTGGVAFANYIRLSQSDTQDFAVPSISMKNLCIYTF